jgi:hypothetical protein
MKKFCQSLKKTNNFSKNYKLFENNLKALFEKADESKQGKMEKGVFLNILKDHLKIEYNPIVLEKLVHCKIKL